MKKKLLAVMLVVVMVLASAVTAFADDTGKITISNAANGETYTIVKLFDAVHGNGTVNYYGSIPESLKDYFELQPNTVNGVQLKAGVAEDDPELIAALKAWAEANKASGTSAVADGGALVFDNIPFGYYVVLTTQGAGNITVTSANPTASVIDKNTTEPTLTKEIDDHDVCVGDTVTYTVTANAPNYIEGTKKVVSYQFEDTLPAFIDNIKIQSIVVNDNFRLNSEGKTVSDEHVVVGPNANKAWSPNTTEAVAWVDNSGNHIYRNDAVITIIYTAKVTAQASEGAGGQGNVNIITMIPKVVGPNGEYEDYEKEWKSEDYTRTYAVALIKTNDETTPKRLENAKFAVKGLTVTEIAKGEYMVVSYDPAADYIDGQEMTTGADGTIIIHGLASDVTLTAKETEAPAGYNKLSDEFTLTPQIVSEEIVRTNTIWYFDTAEKGACKTEQDWIDNYLNRVETTSETVTTKYNSDLVTASASNTVVNKTGSVLPETGGIGTTILYTLGGILVVGAGVLLVARRKMER